MALAAPFLIAGYPTITTAPDPATGDAVQGLQFETGSDWDGSTATIFTATTPRWTLPGGSSANPVGKAGCEDLRGPSGGYGSCLHGKTSPRGRGRREASGEG